MDLALGPTSRRTRRSMRRAVQLEADVMSPLWDGAVSLALTNLSRHGAWLDSDLALEVGEELSVMFTPPRWSSLGLPRLRARATVMRVSLRRRRNDASAGMGLCFTGLSPLTASCLDYVLRGLPPPLPAPLDPGSTAAVEDALSMRLDDGTCLTWVAEAPLLSAAVRQRRPIRMARAHAAPVELASITSFLRDASDPHCANDTPSAELKLDLGSPITAIFQSRAAS